MVPEGSALFSTRRDGLANERACDVIGCVLGNCCVITVSASWDFSVSVVVMLLSEDYSVGVSVMYTPEL